MSIEINDILNINDQGGDYVCLQVINSFSLQRLVQLLVLC